MATFGAPTLKPTLTRRPVVLAQATQPAFSDVAMTATSGKLRGLAAAVKTLERKASAGIAGAPQQLAHSKLQLRAMLGNPRVAVKSQPGSVSLPVWRSFQQSVQVARAAVAGVKPVGEKARPALTPVAPTPAMTQPAPALVQVPVRAPSVTPAEAAVLDPAFVAEISEYLAILIAEAESAEEEVARSAKGEIADVLMMDDVAPLLAVEQTPTGVPVETWEDLKAVLEAARAYAPDAPMPIGLGPAELPPAVAAPIVESIREAEAAAEAPTPPVQPPAPAAQPELGLMGRTKASMREHPLAWGVGGLVGIVAIWKGVGYARKGRG